MTGSTALQGRSGRSPPTVSAEVGGSPLLAQQGGIPAEDGPRPGNVRVDHRIHPVGLLNGLAASATSLPGRYNRGVEKTQGNVMATALRLGTAFAVVLLVGGEAAAQLPTAPPPHPALADVAAEYRRLGLPVPPPGAALVRVNWWRDNGRETAAPYLLGFRIPPAGPGDEPRYFIGSGQRLAGVYIPPDRVETVAPTTRALDRLDVYPPDQLCLAVHCHFRGWDDLARGLYLKSLEHLDGPPVRELREIKWSIWQGRVNERGSDRAEIYRQLRPLADVAPPDVGQLVTHPHLLRRLELTIAPRTAKPGTPEALIDDLVDYWHDNEDRANESGREAYWKLVELGFDAVPALLDHLDDERHTYALVEGFSGFICRPVLVRDLAGEIVYRLAEGRIEGVHVPASQRGVWLDPKLARKWWEGARGVDEGKWLGDRIWRADGPGGAVQTPNENVLRALGAKHPKRLRAAYEEYLADPRKRGAAGGGEFVGPILASRLSREEKLGLFVGGASAGEVWQRVPALRGLAGLDPVVSRRHLLLALREAVPRLERGEWELGDPTPLVALVARARDRDCWDALAAAVRTVPYDMRRHFLRHLGPPVPPGRPDPLRRERIRFLVEFLDDRTAGLGEEEGDRVEIRDFATSQLMGVLGFPVERDSENGVEHDPALGPLMRFVLRGAVRQAAGRELARPGR
ncbi:MAG: hypothetical protein JWO38_4797 [Gemmataceae bacterium]|nr:hypothetical protein [Gemmataceae bacterium]